MFNPASPVQVFIPVYNDIRYFPRALASVLEQEGIDLQVVVSDNASTDGTYEFALKTAAEDDRVTVHRNSTNIGLIPNLNRFADYMTGDYYMLLCSDDMLGNSSALRRAREVLDSDPDIVSVYCDMVYVDGNNRRLITRKFGRSGVFDARVTLRNSILLSRNCFGIPLLSRRSACFDIRYPEQMNYVGDVYFSTRAAERGRVFHIPEPLIWNRYTGENMTRALVNNSKAQFSELIDLFDVQLNQAEKLVRAFHLAMVVPKKRIFLQIARWRS